jgi:Tfp pilus assembly protein PilF
VKLPYFAVLLLAARASAEPDVLAADVKVDLPAVPSFEVPGALYEGTHSVKELRVAGVKMHDSTVTVDGFVTWVYDCATAERKTGESARDVQKRIDADPTLCERPKFYVGDTADARPEQSLWVVDVPRPYNKLELANLKKPDRTMPDRCEPGDKKQKVCPPYKVGDHVTVIGDFKLRSPHAEMNSDGLLVYHGMENVTAKWASAGWTFTAKLAAYGPYSVGTPHRPQLPAVAKVAPDDPSKQLRLGIAEYEQIVARAREDAARRENRRPEEVVPDLSAVVFDKALVPLLVAVREEPRLWRAHYYLGRIDRDAGAWKAAAEDFTRAIRANPRNAASYIALAEIYRRWDYTNEAIAVAAQATANTTDPETWVELGGAYDDKRMNQKAIEAFTKALELRKDDSHVLFMRGQAYFRIGDYAHAKRDLEATATLDLPSEQRAVANAILMQIAAKK